MDFTVHCNGMPLFMLGKGGISFLETMRQPKLLKLSVGIYIIGFFCLRPKNRRLWKIPFHWRFSMWISNSCFFIHRPRSIYPYACTYTYIYICVWNNFQLKTTLMGRYSLFKMHCIFQFTSFLVIIVCESWLNFFQITYS